MSYHCNTCNQTHDAGVTCEAPNMSEKEKYQRELMRKFDSFAVGYGETTTVVLGALRTRLFGETYDK